MIKTKIFKKDLEGLEKLRLKVEQFFALGVDVIESCPEDANNARMVIQTASKKIIVELDVYFNEAGGWRIGGVAHSILNHHWNELVKIHKEDK